MCLYLGTLGGRDRYNEYQISQDHIVRLSKNKQTNKKQKNIMCETQGLVLNATKTKRQ